MDDLIRQSADDYPLKTGGSDWEKVATGMQAAMQQKPSNRKRYWWLLLLLLPLLIAVPVYYYNKEFQKPVTSSNTTATDTTVQQQGSNTIINNADKAPEQAIAGTDVPASQAKEMGSAGKKKDLLRGNHFITSTTTERNNNENILESRNNKTIATIDESNDNNNSRQFILPADVIAGNNSNTNNSSNNNNYSAIENNNKTASDAIIAGNEIKKNATEKKDTIAANINTDKDGKAVATPQKDSVATAKRINLKHTAPIKAKGLYAGAAAGLDVTAVKFREVEKPGYSAALVVGYRINNHWSVESGLMWDNKNYYSPGEYFDRKRTDIPTTTYIHYVYGTCRMYEVPLNIKYDFNSKKLSGFYVSAGLSSYIMKKENYEYHATGSSGNYYVGKRAYKNSTNNLFSVANISGGYQFIFKNNNSLRVEPYLKVPLRGLGIGKLPFSSTGISAVYTLPLHKSF
ncbi:porin family protein [Ilyomonas limi]|nr:porin family protein [Ilyomonas limi]